MHALVELAKGIGDDRHVAYGGLFTVPVGEFRDVGKEQGVGDTALGSRFQRVFEQGVAAQVFVHEIRILPEFDALIEEMNQDIVQLVARNGQNHEGHDQNPSPQDRLSVAQHGICQADHGGSAESAFLRGTNREKRKQGRKEGDGENEGGGDAESDEVAEMAIGRHLGEVHAQESKRRRETRQEYRVQVQPDGFNDGIVSVLPGTQTLLQGHQQVHAVRHDNHQYDGGCRRDGRGKGQPGPHAKAH